MYCFNHLNPLSLVPQGSILEYILSYIIMFLAENGRLTIVFAENSRLTSLQRVAARRVVSLSSCYFQQKPSPQERMGLKWLKKNLDHDLSRN